jgi:anthranilate synthase/aminodeoxychorismate synthase-like glutamine amidotransferase
MTSFNPRVLIIDNYDSFTYNLVQYLGELSAEIDVVRNDAEGVDRLLERGYDRIVVSPGPGRPEDAGMSMEVMVEFPRAGIPALGVCLGHQSLVQAHGGEVLLNNPVHGKSATVSHSGTGLFDGLPNPLTVGRYHSLIVSPDLPRELVSTAEVDGLVMAVRHRELPAYGVQFHPESILTDSGKQLLRNFLEIDRHRGSDGGDS